MIVITMADILKYLNMLLIIAIANVLVVPVKILKKHGTTSKQPNSGMLDPMRLHSQQAAKATDQD